MPNFRSSTIYGYAFVALAAVIWGSIGIIVRLIDLPVTTMVFLRVVFAASAVAIALAAGGRLSDLKVGREGWPLILFGLTLAVNWLAFFLSVRMTRVASAVLITYLSPVIVASFAPFILKERFEKTTGLAVFLAVAGTFAILYKGGVLPIGRELTGSLWAFLSALTYASLVLASKPMMRRFPVGAILFYEEVVVALVLAPFAAPGLARVNQVNLGLLALLGSVQTAAAAGLYLTGLKRIPAARAGVLSYLDPLSAAILAALFLGEIPSTGAVIGGLLILTAGYLVIAHSGHETRGV